MSEWKKFRLNELCKVTSSKRIFSHEYVSSGIPFYRSKEVIEKAFGDSITEILFISEERFREIKKEFGSPKEGDILISSVGARSGIPYLVKKEDGEFYFKDGNLIWIKEFSKTLNSNFLLYWLQSNIGQESLESIMIGSAQPALTIVGVSELYLNIPNISEQKEIATVLSCLDRKIENLRKQNETLERIAQTLFKHWFVDFEFPNEDGKPYKSSGGEMVRSELGEISAGWRLGKLRDITAVINGRAYKQTEFREKGTPIVRIQNLTGKGQTVYSDLTLDKDKYISKGDLIYAWSATFGPYIWRGVKSIYHYHIWKLNCFNPAFKYYLYIHLKKVSDRVQGQGTGSIFTHITKELMESQELSIPEEKVMERWHSLATPIFDKIMINHEQIETLTQTRDVLLPKLMSGKLRITE